MAAALPNTDISHCYSGDCSSVFAPATSAFEEACGIFESQGTNDSKKRERLQSIQATSLGDLLDAVNNAQDHYKNNQRDSKSRRCIEAVSQRIHYYGNIMDVLAQHHPSYVTLAWGAMRLLVGVCEPRLAVAKEAKFPCGLTLKLIMVDQAIVEHEKMGVVITTGLLDIADALRRVELASSLYPTASIKQNASVLYAHIIRFLLRALEWYEEGEWKRALHSITKPAPLRYNDILESIHRVTESIGTHAMMSSQAEQRDMHKELVAIRRIVEASQETHAIEHEDLGRKLQLLTDLTNELKSLIVSGQADAHTERVQIHRSLSNIQPTQFLHIISAQCAIDHQACLQASHALRDRRRSARSKCAPFWESARMQAWNQSSAPSLISIKVPFSSRQPVQDFCTNVIDQLLNARIAILWILKSKDDTHSVVAALKTLIYQAASHTYQLRRESDMHEELDRFLHAELEDHYLDVLIGLIRHLKVVYITVQLEAIQPASAAQLMSSLQQLTERLPRSRARTVVRILVLTWDPGSAMGGDPRRIQYPGLHVRRAAGRKKARLPIRPLSTE